MSARKIKDGKVDGEKVYFKGHAQATYMSDGRSVEEAINDIDTGGEVPDLSDYATKQELKTKVDKVDGKQLSTEDFTTLLKQKLDGLSNYDDTEISQAVSKLRTDLDTLVSGDTTTAIKTFNEVIAFLDGIEDSESLDAIIASIEQQIAAKGTVTSVTAGNGLTGGSIIESGTISMPSVITAGTKGRSNSIQLTPSNPNGSETNASGTVIGSITVDEFGRVTDIKECSINLRTVYPKEVTTSNSGLMTASDKSKLNQCITSSAASATYATKTSLGNKQDTLVSGTNIKTINGQSILGSGDIVIEGGSGDSSEEVYVWYLDNVSEGTISLQVYEKLKTVKTIIGVNNSKFYHASSRLIFRGNITALTLTTIYTNVVISYNFSFHKIEDGYDYISELYSYAIIENYIRVEHGTSDTTFTLTPNTFHVWDEVASLDLSFVEETTGVTNEYTFQFTSGATPTSLTLPDTIQWVNGAPNIEANKTYQVSIVNNIGLIVSV